MSPAVEHVAATAREAQRERAHRQAVRRWHQRSGRLVGYRLFRAVTRGFQIGSAVAIIGYVALDFTGFLHQHNTFLVPHITVRGNTRVTSSEMIRAARLAPSIDLWAWPLTDIRARVELHPRIRTVRVIREFPDEMVLEIEERQPVALILGDTLLELDADGVVLGPYERGRSPLGPVLTGHGLTDLRPGTRIQAPAVSEALAMSESYRAADAAQRVPIAEIALDAATGPVLWLEPGVQVPCPDGIEPIQWARLDAVLSDLHARGTGLHRVAAIDLRFAHIVPVRLRTIAAG